ncbi:unnamed protein product [Amoebophrya sp. A25]|nr:unnamed protein product [Amoebophrya sp. A25]|eukprot:GSA25T00000142001.1
MSPPLQLVLLDDVELEKGTTPDGPSRLKNTCSLAVTETVPGILQSVKNVSFESAPSDTDRFLEEPVLVLHSGDAAVNPVTFYRSEIFGADLRLSNYKEDHRAIMERREGIVQESSKNGQDDRVANGLNLLGGIEESAQNQTKVVVELQRYPLTKRETQCCSPCSCFTACCLPGRVDESNSFLPDQTNVTHYPPRRLAAAPFYPAGYVRETAFVYFEVGAGLAGSASFDERLAMARRLVDAIDQWCRSGSMKLGNVSADGNWLCNSKSEEAAFLERRNDADGNGRKEPPEARIPKTREFLVLINPKSGPGHALRRWQQEVRPILNAANRGNKMAFEVIVTERANHAFDMVRDMSEDRLLSYHGIIVVSGDGLVHEVYRGLCTRPPTASGVPAFSVIPVAHMLGGSGNALGSSILHVSGEPLQNQSAALVVLRDETCALDLWRVSVIRRTSIFSGVPSKKSQPVDVPQVQVDGANDGSNLEDHVVEWRPSFLSVFFGLMADIDIESEWLRCLGSLRFTLYAVRNVARFRTYRGRVRYRGREIHKDEYAVMMERLLSRKNNDNRGRAGLCQDHGNSSLSTSATFSPLALGDSCCGSVGVEFGAGNIAQQGSSTITASSGTTTTASSSMKSRADNFSSRSLWQSILPASGGEASPWAHRFLTLWAASQPMVTEHEAAVPFARANDGKYWLIYCAASMPRSQIVRFLLAIEHGTHLDLLDGEHCRLFCCDEFEVDLMDPRTSLSEDTTAGGLTTTNTLEVEVGPSGLEDLEAASGGTLEVPEAVESRNLPDPAESSSHRGEEDSPNRSAMLSRRIAFMSVDGERVDVMQGSKVHVTKMSHPGRLFCSPVR